MGKKVDSCKVLEEIGSNYIELEKSLINQLKIQTPNHYYTTGSYREGVWKSLFDGIIPKKYCIDQGVFIIDSYGNISREVDLAVYDETYTPYIFRCGKIKFIPIEAVSVVVQCKSRIISSQKMQNELKEWVTSIDQLKTSLDSVARMVTGIVDNSWQKYKNSLTQTSTRPIKILCALSISEPMLKENKTAFDIVIAAKKNRLIKHISDEDENFIFWNNKLNHYDLDRYSEENGKKKYAGGNEFENEKQYREAIIKKYTEENEANGQGEQDASMTLKKRKLSDLRVVTNNSSDENVILSLTFQLNQLLMLINNPMLFPHSAYAKRFSDILSKTE